MRESAQNPRFAGRFRKPPLPTGSAPDGHSGGCGILTPIPERHCGEWAGAAVALVGPGFRPLSWCPPTKCHRLARAHHGPRRGPAAGRCRHELAPA